MVLVLVGSGRFLVGFGWFWSGLVAFGRFQSVSVGFGPFRSVLVLVGVGRFLIGLCPPPHTGGEGEAEAGRCGAAPPCGGVGDARDQRNTQPQDSTGSAIVFSIAKCPF